MFYWFLFSLFKIWLVCCVLLIVGGLVTGIMNLRSYLKKEELDVISLTNLYTYAKGICYWCGSVVIISHVVGFIAILSLMTTVYENVKITIVNKLRSITHDNKNENK